MVSIGENHTTEGETPSQPELLGHTNFTKVTFGPIKVWNCSLGVSPLQYSALFALRQSIEVCGSPGITLRLITTSVKFTYLGQRPKTPSVSYNSVLLCPAFTQCIFLLARSSIDPTFYSILNSFAVLCSLNVNLSLKISSVFAASPFGHYFTRPLLICSNKIIQPLMKLCKSFIIWFVF